MSHSKYTTSTLKNQRQSPAESQRRYIAQIERMIETAARMNNARVTCALTGLLTKVRNRYLMG
jgi:hypothetical protein